MVSLVNQGVCVHWAVRVRLQCERCANAVRKKEIDCQREESNERKDTFKVREATFEGSLSHHPPSGITVITIITWEIEIDDDSHSTSALHATHSS